MHKLFEHKSQLPVSVTSNGTCGPNKETGSLHVIFARDNNTCINDLSMFIDIEADHLLSKLLITWPINLVLNLKIGNLNLTD